MEDFKVELMNKAIEYCNGIDELDGKEPPLMLIDFVIEKFRQHRNYPNFFTDDAILDDMKRFKSTMAIAVVDLFLKQGSEGEKSHSDSGVQMVYENAYLSHSVFADVLPFVKVIK